MLFASIVEMIQIADETETSKLKQLKLYDKKEKLQYFPPIFLFCFKHMDNAHCCYCFSEIKNSIAVY